MAQEYFSHDYNSRNDRKMVAFLKAHKAKGLGVYWTIIEMLHEEGGYLPMDIITYTSIGAPIGCTSEFVKKVVEDCISKFKLLVSEEGKFTSDRVKKNLNKRQEIRELKVKAGKASAAAKQQDSTHVQHVSTDVQQNPTNKRKGKEKKRKRESTGKKQGTHDISESNLFRKPTIPTIEMVQETFLRNGGTEEMAKKFYETHTSTEWHLRGSPIRNFTSLVPGYIEAWNANARAPGSTISNKYEQQLAEARKNFKPTPQ